MGALLPTIDRKANEVRDQGLLADSICLGPFLYYIFEKFGNSTHALSFIKVVLTSYNITQPLALERGNMFRGSFDTIRIMKNCIIIHGGPLSDIGEKPHHLNQLYWQPWVKSELEKQGLSCNIPAMPDPWFPNYKDWKSELEKEPVNASTILVGHSRGAAFLVRWLSETKQSIAKLIMIAPNLSTNSVNPTLQDFILLISIRISKIESINALYLLPKMMI